eukprot:4690198-Amphidinium_carterae.1
MKFRNPSATSCPSVRRDRYQVSLSETSSSSNQFSQCDAEYKAPNQPRPPARSGTRRGERPRKGTPKPADPVCRLAQQSSASRTNHAAQPA